MLTPLRARAFRALRGRFFYGWTIVAVTMLVMFGTGPGQSHLIGLFFEPMSADLGLSRTSLALAYGGATLFAALMLPRVGRLIDRHGALRVLGIVVGALGFVALAFSAASHWLVIALCFGGLRFLGQGSMALGCVNVVSQWFEHRRGFALGLMALGFPISMAIHPPMVQWLIEQVGWREAWRWLGLATWVFLLPPLLLLVYNRPEELGLRPDDAPSDGTTPGPIAGLTLAQAIRTPAFYIVAACLFTISMLVTSLHVENKGILMRHGLTAQSAALMFTVSGVVAAIAMPIVGLLLDRVRTERMVAGGLLVMTASLLSATFVDGLTSAVVYAAIFGLNNGVGMTYFAFLWPRYFGRRHLGSIQGLGQMVGIVGASLGPLPLAIAVDLSGDYDVTLRALAVLPFCLSIGALIWLRAPSLEPAPERPK